MSWRIASASVVGTSHVKTGKPCQDSARVRLVEAPDGPVLVSAVSDGAGSAAHSDIGSRAAVTTAIYLIENFFLAGGTIASIERQTALSWLAQIQTVITSFASEGSVPTKEFSCTLLVAIIGPESSAFFQVGDGAMVFLEAGDDAWTYVFWPQHGEYINTTNFVTSSQAADVMDFTSASRQIESFSSFSDGIENLVLHYATRTVHDPFFNAMISPVKQGQLEGLDEGLSESLRQYLSSERVCDRTDDDKSLVLATRIASPTPCVLNVTS
jgi:hypothetical protein